MCAFFPLRVKEPEPVQRLVPLFLRRTVSPWQPRVQVPCVSGESWGAVMRTDLLLPRFLHHRHTQTHSHPPFLICSYPSLLLWSDLRRFVYRALFMFSYNSLSLCLCLICIFPHSTPPPPPYPPRCENTRRLFAFTLLSFLLWFYDPTVHVSCSIIISLTILPILKPLMPSMCLIPVVLVVWNVYKVVN